MEKNGINDEIDEVLEERGSNEPVDIAEPVDITEPVDIAEPVDITEPVDMTESIKTTESIDNSESELVRAEESATTAVEDGDETVDNFDADVDKPLIKSVLFDEETLEYGINQAIFVDKNDERVENLWTNHEEDAVESAEAVESMDNLKGLDNLESSDTQERLLIKKKKQWAVLLFAVIVVFCVSLYFWISNVYRGDVAIAYAKDNALYVYDLKDAPEQVSDTISDGGNYRYYYSAWGARFSEDGEYAYYLVNQNAYQIGDLYEWDMKEKTETLIDSDVADFSLEISGQNLLYIKAENNAPALYYFDGESHFIAAGVTDANAPCGLAQDNRFVYYATDVNGKTTLHSYDLETQEDMVLSENLETCIPADKQNTLYYVANEDEEYILYSYVFGLTPKKVLNEGVYVTYFEVLPNEKSLLYCTSGENVKYADLIEDDITDETQTEAQEEIREAMLSGRGIQTPLQSTYLLDHNTSTKLEKNVIAITAMQDKSGFMIGYSTDGFEKIKLSGLESLEDADYQYYMSLLNSQKDLFYADAAGKFYEISSPNADLTTMTVTKDGSRIAYLASDSATGETTLITEVVGKPESAVAVATHVESMAFLNDSHILAYYYDYANDVGRVETWKDGKKNEVSSNASGLYFANDAAAVYFIENVDERSGNGTLCVYENSEKKVLEENVFSFQYKGRKKIAAIVNYDINTEKGDLYYYNGKKSMMVDTDIAAIFMY